MAGVEELKVAAEFVSVWIAVPGSSTTSVAWPASMNCQVGPGVVAPPDAAVGAAERRR